MRPLAHAGTRLLVGVGGRLFNVFEGTYDFVSLAGETLRSSLTRPQYLSITVGQFQKLIVESIPLVVLAAASTGAVMALQFGQGMGRFGGKLYVPTVVAVSLVRALGPIFTSLMIAGRVGAGVAAEIAGMAVTQQVDAIRALGTDPNRKLVVPRIVVLIVGVPLLTMLADVAGILGGLLVAPSGLGITMDLYLRKSLDAIRLIDFAVGTGKTAVFGGMIGLIACYNGLRTRDGTVGIGTATTRSVVAASMFVMVSDVLITKISWILGW